MLYTLIFNPSWFREETLYRLVVQEQIYNRFRCIKTTAEVQTTLVDEKNKYKEFDDEAIANRHNDNLKVLCGGFP